MRRLVAWSLVAACAARAPVEPVEPDEHDEHDAGTEGDETEVPDVPTAVATGGLVSEGARELAAMRTSTYTHRTSVDEASGRFDYDCSGFVGYALRRIAPEAFAELQRETVRRPLAKHFVAFLASRSTTGATGWRRLARATDLQPGDVVAWLKPADVTSHNTGHVMIVREQPMIDPAHPDRLEVPVIDSTSVRHGRDDSRASNATTGLGTGRMILVIDHDAAPIGYRWSHGRKARVHTTTISLGRLLQ